METVEYQPGDVVPVSSSLCCVVHEPPHNGHELKAFYAGEDFPLCEECGKKVRYFIPSRILRKHAES